MRRIVLLASLVLALTAGSGRASSSTPIVVSQVYGSGGNTGAAYQNDYVELFNRSSSAIDLSGWTVQYATSSGTSWSTATLTGTLPAGRYYLVQFASAGAVGSIIPAPDALGTTNLAASGGKVALVHGTAALTCGASVGSCSAASGVVDLVGYGTATDFEAAAAPSPDATHAALRDAGGCTDTDSNAADFSAAAPAPRNSSAAAVSCGSQPSPSATASQGVSIDADVQQSLAIALDHATLSFGQIVAGTTPAPLHERVTVTSNLATGYALSIRRTAFVPADLPLGAGVASAPAGATIAAGLAGGVIAALAPAAATDLLLGTTAAAAPVTGDVWDALVGFSAPIPTVTPGHYTASVTYTVVGR